MPDGWVRTRIGDIAEVVGGGTPSTKTPEYWGGPIPWITPSEVTAQEGDVIFETERTITPEGLGKSGARLLPPKAVLLTSRATVGAVAMAGVEMATNQGFASLIAGPEAIPEFLAIWCQHNRVEFEIRASGSTFPEISKSLVKDVPVLLPPLVVQRRVVDLVDAVDTYAAAAGRAAAETRRALDAHLEGFDTWTVSDGTALGDLASMGSGPSWKAEQERSVAGPGTLPVVKITNTRPDGRLVMDERAFVADLPASTGVLDEDSLVMIRTNGNRDRIGNVYRSTPETVGHAVSAFQIAVHPFGPADSAYLFWYLRSPRVQRLISEAASGTTGLGNVAVRWLRQLEVPWPDASTRAVFVDTAEAMLTASESASDVGEGLSGLRSALLGELLSGDREIPGSYDELVGLVA